MEIFLNSINQPIFKQSEYNVGEISDEINGPLINDTFITQIVAGGISKLNYSFNGFLIINFYFFFK